MKKTHFGILWTLALCLLLTGTSGCQYERVETPARKSPASAADPTAECLHDISGSLLLFYNAYLRMPEDTRELCLATGLHPKQLIDPATGQPMTFLRKGNPVRINDVEKHVVFLASTGPTEETRWTIVTEQQSPRAIAATVLALPRDTVQSILKSPPESPASQPVP